MEFFKNSNALESLRSSDFDNMSAYAEVIDNSLQADAKNIKIDFFSLQVKANYERIDEIAFGDDGTGMDTDTLHACLQLGWSSRYNDRSGIGRFEKDILQAIPFFARANISSYGTVSVIRLLIHGKLLFSALVNMTGRTKLVVKSPVFGRAGRNRP